MGGTANDNKYTVTTKDGPVLGYVDKNEEGTFIKFKGIPYAKPPTGILRFQPPHPVQPWENTLDCRKDPPFPITTSFNQEIIGSEDCLYLEISTPNLKPEKLLPVMFWIGCNRYAFNLDNIYDPTFLISQNIIFVRCGYRLGPFGFLSIHDFTAPGNCGLKDLVMSLKWVQRNIKAFGGDPDNVTIFGSSTGGAIIHLMMLSPLASGLFHKAIIQSACALNNWSLTKNPSQSVMELANELGIQKSNKIEVVEELRTIPPEDIMKAFLKLTEKKCSLNDYDAIDSIFKPCIEIEFEGQSAFLTKSPLSVIKSGNFNKVPVIIGSNNIEAAVFQHINKEFYEDFQKYNENVGLLVPKSLSSETKLSKNIGHQILKFYLGGEEHLRKDTRAQYLQLISDYYFLYYVNKTVRLQIEFSPDFPIYYYIVNYSGEWSVPENLDFFNSLGHCAEAPFIFGIKISNTPICKGSRDSVTTRKRVVKMWTNFAKYGNPTPDEDDQLLQIKWDPVESKEKLNYLSIGSELTKGRNPFQERMSFWDALHKEHTFLRTVTYVNDLGVSW